MNVGLIATLLLALLGILPAAVATSRGASALAEAPVDGDGNGREDLLDRWLAGAAGWQDLREAARPRRASLTAPPEPANPAKRLPADGPWSAGQVRLLCLGAGQPALAPCLKAAGELGQVRVLHALDRFGGVSVLAVDEAGLRALLEADPPGRILLDRDGTPALDRSRALAGAEGAAADLWGVGDDWSGTVAILDSGCDTAHGDLGDLNDDDRDGPAPAVGDAQDWYPADSGWPLYSGYKVVGWRDVTDDFPEAVGPWDYHYHGTALASVVAGSGHVDPTLAGLAPGGRLTIVKFYDFDQTWHAWLGDYLAACAWTLDHREIYRVRSVLTAVNWDVDAGLSEAMTAFLAAGVVPVAAMGNFGDDPAGPGYPAALPQVLTVGSVTDAAVVSAFSGRGLPGQAKPDLMAPGGAQRQVDGWIEACDNEPDDTYSERQGTSLAAAHAAAAVALLDDALHKNGVRLDDDANGARSRMAVLRATCARVVGAEDGLGDVTALDGDPVSDPRRGWGLLRVDAAVRALLMPLIPGRDQVDTLSADMMRPVAARRLNLSPDVRYLIEVRPSAGLDVALRLVDPRWLDDDPAGGLVMQRDDSGPGVSEFTYFRSSPERWALLAVQRVSGSGTVTLKVREADVFTAQGATLSLPGVISGAPNLGHLDGGDAVSIVVPSLVEVDQLARSLNVLSTDGTIREGWPVFVFPHPSSVGGMTQPALWDLDGDGRDEIVLGSQYGSVYFFRGDGSFQEILLDFNLALSAPVGVVAAGGERRMAVVNRNGILRTWAAGPVLRSTVNLLNTQPLPPAAGTLLFGPSEQLVVAFSDGTLIALDADGTLLPGWPVELAAALEVPPVLCDLDDDGVHEVIQPVRNAAAGTLTMRVLRGDGRSGPGDGTAVPTPAGGSWRALSWPVVAGRYGTGDLRVTLAGLVDNGGSGDRAELGLALGGVDVLQRPVCESLPGLRIRGTTNQGVLTVSSVRLAAPVAWNFLGGTGTEAAVLFSLRWAEILYGLTSIPGAAAGWIRATEEGDPLVGRQSLLVGGPSSAPEAGTGCLLVPLADGIHVRVDILDARLDLVPMPAGSGAIATWNSERGDSRNSGARERYVPVAAAPTPALGGLRLSAFPNPGSGRFQFSWLGGEPAPGATVEIYDLAGRRLRRLAAAPGDGPVFWDGSDARGRPAAAGAYLAVGRSDGRRAVTRVMLQR